MRYTWGRRFTAIATTFLLIFVSVPISVHAEGPVPEWAFITYGNGAKEARASMTGGLTGTEGSVQITAGVQKDGRFNGKNNSGKLLTDSFDGLSFYYTTVPENKNFTLRAKVNVDQWYHSNGQEGLGLMASDRLGGSGWNNSYMALVSRMEYYTDDSGSITSDTSGHKISQRLGIASQEKKGLTPDNIALIEGNDTDAIATYFRPSQYPLEQRYPTSGNVIGNCVNLTSNENITQMYLSINKNNTGYFVTYESVDGSYSVTKKYYDTKTLSHLDTENVYVGFFASRYAQATFSEVTFTITDPAGDTPAEEEPVEIIETEARIDSADTTNTSAYDIRLATNADGRAEYFVNGQAVGSEDITDGVPKTVRATLSLGENEISIKFTPTPGYSPGHAKTMSSYDEITLVKKVTYNAYTGDIIYVAPGAAGIGSPEDPADLQTALFCAQPGQMIIMTEGTYKSNQTITIPRGTNGTAESPIYLLADENGADRPVIDGSACGGIAFSIAGDYWYIQGIDVTGSPSGNVGLHLNGNHNTIDNVRTFKNGDTGLAICGRSMNDTEKALWPSHNLVLNCTSFDNADTGFEDADGFAAKLSCGEGNVFDGCIAYNNADDGWDLFSKVQNGTIGAVTIKNCIAYANGYLSDGTNAGNGNGFKMGGESMSGHHILENCLSFDNKSKGIDSNSCPDITIKNSTSFNNGTYNVALYTNTAPNTDFSASGILSFRTRLLENKERLEPKGSQDNSKIYRGSNYFWNSATAPAHDSKTEVTADWFKSVDTGMNYDTHIYPTTVSTNYSASVYATKVFYAAGAGPAGPVSRNEDGRLNVGDLLVLTSAAAPGTGADLNVNNLTPSGKINITGTVTRGLVTEAEENPTPNVVNTGDGAPILVMFLMLACAWLFLMNYYKCHC